MSQTKRHSLLESLVNVAIGYGVALISQLLIFPLYGVHLPLGDNIAIGLWFTAISIVRSYSLRRWFNRVTVKQSGGDR
jgi:hypothetical protein